MKKNNTTVEVRIRNGKIAVDDGFEGMLDPAANSSVFSDELILADFDFGNEPTAIPVVLVSSSPKPAAQATNAQKPVKSKSAAQATIGQKPVKSKPAAQATIGQKPVKSKPAAQATIGQKPVKSKPTAQATIGQKPQNSNQASQANSNQQPQNSTNQASQANSNQQPQNSNQASQANSNQQPSKSKFGRFKEKLANLFGEDVSTAASSANPVVNEPKNSFTNLLVKNFEVHQAPVPKEEKPKVSKKEIIVEAFTQKTIAGENQILLETVKEILETEQEFRYKEAHQKLVGWFTGNEKLSSWFVSNYPDKFFALPSDIVEIISKNIK